jgi:hypothetical protein
MPRWRAPTKWTSLALRCSIGVRRKSSPSSSIRSTPPSLGWEAGGIDGGLAQPFAARLYRKRDSFRTVPQAAEKEAAARRETDAQVLEDAERLIAVWNERQAKRMPMLFSPTIGAGYWFLLLPGLPHNERD